VSHRSATFRIDPRSRVLGPKAAALEPLQQALRQGHSILTRQGAPISARPEPRQKLYVQTSGSSGAPKMICRSPDSWTRSFDLTAQRFGIGARDCYGLLGDLGHSLSLFAATEALHLGADLLCLDRMRPPVQLEQLTTQSVTVIYATPTQLRLLLGAATSPVLPSLGHLFIGGGTLDAPLRDALARALPQAQILEFFGASETSFITMADARTPHGSVGKAYPGVTLRVAEPFETAEIWVRSPYLFDGYAQGDSPDTRWDGDFLSVGELGYLDEDGNLFLRGRKTRMVTIADQNVFPDEVERTLQAHPGILHAAVLAVPDAQRGHALVAVLQPCGPVDPARLRQMCRQALGAASVPRRFVEMARLPLLPAGKPDLQALAAQLEEQT
jgi:long-chain acyl-CoA synthetase